MTRCLLALTLLIVAGFAFQRCTFEPNNEYVNPIEPPKPLALDIEVNDPNFTDPFYIIEPTNFTFTLKDLTKPLIDYVVTIDGKIIAEGTDGKIQFYLYPHSVAEGTHTVKMTIRAATNSGSLAEKLGGEYYLIEKTFQLINDSTKPPAITPTAAYEDGKLTIRWNTINQKNFYYVIKRTYSPYNPMQDSIIRNTQLNNFIDVGYVGGEVTYTIAATGFGFERYDLGSVTFKDDPVDFELRHGEGKRVSLVWTNSKVAVENTELMIETQGRKLTMPMTSSGNMVIDTLVLGEDAGYWITTSRAGYGWQQSYKRTPQIKSPQQIKAFTAKAMLVNQNRLLLLTPKAIYRYVLPSLTIEDSLLYQNNEDFTGMVVNEDGSRAVLTTANKNLYEFNPMDFDAPWNTLELYTASIFFTGGSDPIRQIVLGNLSQNGLLTVVVGKYGNNTQLVYDINNNVVTWNAPSFIYLNTVHPPVVSNDGSLLANDYPALTKGDVYQWNGSGFDKIGTVAAGRKHFRPGNREIINGTRLDEYTISPGAVRIYDLTTLPADPTQSLTQLRWMNFAAIENDAYFTETGFDKNTNLFYVRYMENVFSTLKLYDANTMNFVKEVTAFVYRPGTHQFENNYHLSDRGFIEEVK